MEKRGYASDLKHIRITTLLPLRFSTLNCPLWKYTCALSLTQIHTHICSVEGVFGGGTIDRGVLACGKGNHGAGAWVARVRVSAHTVWMWSSFPLHKLLMNHMIPMLRSLQMRHSFLTRHRSSQMKRCSSLLRRRNFPKCHMFPAVHSLLMRHRSGVLSMSLEVQDLCWRPVPVC